MAIMALALDRQRLEHPLLMRVRPDVEVGERDRRGLAERAPIVLAQRTLQLVAVDGRVVRLEVLDAQWLSNVIRTRSMTCAASIDDEPDVPLQAVEERRVREVRRADERGRQARAALQQPGLRVQLGRASVERDADLRTERHELVDCPLLRRTHVGRRDDADASAALP